MQPLFSRNDSFSVKAHLKAALLQEIERYDEDRLLNSNVDDLVKYFEEKFAIVVPSLREAEAEVDQREVSLEPSRQQDPFWNRRGENRLVPGTRVTLEVPFDGDADYFYVQASTHTFSPPTGEVSAQTLTFKHESTRANTSEVKSAIDDWIKSVNQNLSWLVRDFAGYGQELGKTARAAIDARRSKLLANRNLVSSLGFRLKPRVDSATPSLPPVARRKVIPRPPPATTGSFKPEPVLEMVEYEHILTVLQGMALVMERSPTAFHTLDEEAIRTHFLVQLNGHYQGEATGETFNFSGKTDILIRSEGRNVFIGECKIWRGAIKLTETLDQLLGYLTWRDGKAAVLIFSRNKDFSNVLREIPETVEKHSKLRKSVSQTETSFRYVFRHKDDDAKDLLVTVMAFNIPSP